MAAILGADPSSDFGFWKLFRLLEAFSASGSFNDEQFAKRTVSFEERIEMGLV
jgi:hypothetical protein